MSFVDLVDAKRVLIDRQAGETNTVNSGRRVEISLAITHFYSRNQLNIYNHHRYIIDIYVCVAPYFNALAWMAEPLDEQRLRKL